jgi:sn-glycerol 3-phosphate transport system substrate-binding protein
MKKLLLIIIFVLISNTIIAKNIELSFWFSSGFNAKECIEEMVDEYNNLYIGVKVNAVFQGSYEQMETKLLTAAVVGQLPDVVQEKFEYMDLYKEEGLIPPINAFITEHDSKDIFPSIYWPGRF